MRRFAFLQCVRCLHFHPKQLHVLPSPGGAAAFATAAYVGICKAAEPPEWVVWQSLEWAASKTGSCPDCQPRPPLNPGCPLGDLTASTAGLPYPQACVYHATGACPKS